MYNCAKLRFKGIRFKNMNNRIIRSANLNQSRMASMLQLEKYGKMGQQGPKCTQM